jgi:hypothetical protein
VPFTSAGAWEFIADTLDKGVPLYEVPLDKPPGTTGFYFTIEVCGVTVYVKLQLGNGKVFGRSFHCAEKGGST